MLVVSVRSILLLIGTVHGLVLAVLLWRSRTNRIANRLLAALLLLFVLRVVPFIIGYAGFYDRWPWLSFLPYDWSLGYGALIWLYTLVVTTGVLPHRWWWHLVPAAVQGLYYSIVFVQPLRFKDRFNETIHEPIVVPIEQLWSFVALGIYLIVSWRAFRRYQSWLDGALSNREEFRLGWLRWFLLALAATLVVWVGTVAWSRLITSLDYFALFPLYIWFSLLVYGLGLGGVRHAALAYPYPSTLAADEPTTPEKIDAPASTDWQAVGARWSATLRQEGWWRDPDLTAPRLARLLATNGSYLTRALNDGLGVNFNQCVNTMRVEAVQAELADPANDRDILAVALDAGFRSKASFNRVFKTLTGVTPTEFRRAHRSATSQLS